VLDPYSAENYISLYMMKTNSALSKLINDACNSVRETCGNAGQVLRATGNALLNGQKISVQHAVYICTGLPFRGSSRDTVFVPSAPPADQTFLVKPDWELKSLPPQSIDCMSLSIVDKYALRKRNPHFHELAADDVCLADFACLFSPTRKGGSAGDDINDDALEEAEPEGDAAAAEEPPPFGRLFEQKRHIKRRQEKIFWYVHYKLHDDSEAYYQEQLRLYFPWAAEAIDPVWISADEDACLCAGHTTFESRYIAVRNELENNRKRYEYNDRIDWDEVQRTAKELVDADEILFQTGPHRSADTETDFVLHDKTYDFGQDLGITASTSAPASTVSLFKMTDDDFRGEARRPTWYQLRFLYHIMHQYRYGIGLPFHEFLTGGAGTGKSVVLSVIAEAINRMHNSRVGIDPNSMKVLLVAYTGSAAFNVHGSTIHHAFRIPFGCRLLPYRRLPAEERSKMRDIYSDLLCLMIDEISVTGATLLYYLHRRLQDIFESSLPFGGILVLACGDLYQLKPVGDNYCFQGIEIESTNNQPFPILNIWADLFQMYELNTILRQRHGFPFAEALNRLRTGDHTPEDIEFLKRFEIVPSNPPPKYSIFYRHIFATHRQRDNHNQRVFESTVANEIDVEAKDYVIATFVHDKDRHFFLQKAKNMDDSKTATL
jgi:hypothetical protein